MGYQQVDTDFWDGITRSRENNGTCHGAAAYLIKVAFLAAPIRATLLALIITVISRKLLDQRQVAFGTDIMMYSTSLG